MMDSHSDIDEYKDRNFLSEDDIDDEEIDQEDAWQVITSFFNEKGLVRQQLDSFINFAKYTIMDIIEKQDSFELDKSVSYSQAGVIERQNPVIVKFGRAILYKPVVKDRQGRDHLVYPHEARLRNVTYESKLSIDIESAELDENGFEGNKEHWNDVNFGSIPVMVRSHTCNLDDNTLVNQTNECEYDQGGYFIVNGSEKVLISQERMSNNQVFIFKQTDSAGKEKYTAEIRSTDDQSFSSTSTTYIFLSNPRTERGTIEAQLTSGILGKIPLVIVFMALGFPADGDILQHVCYDQDDTEMTELLRPSLEAVYGTKQQSSALDYIAKTASGQGKSHVSLENRINRGRDILENQFLPHIGRGSHTETKKAFFFGYMVHRLLQVVLGRREPDDRDHFANKRLDLAGPLLADLFRKHFSRVVRTMGEELKRTYRSRGTLDPAKAIKPSIITQGIRYSLSTGNWSANRGESTKTGVAQALNRLTFISTLSHLRRLNTPIGKESKLSKPRQLHNTHWGMVCPAETPEGQQCGIVKNLALMASVSVGSESSPILSRLTELSIETLEECSTSQIPDAFKIFVNGAWVGIHRGGNDILDNLSGIKSLGHSEVSIVKDIENMEIRIFSDAGRCYRPLFKVDENQSLLIKKHHIQSLKNGELKYEDLVQQGKIELLGIEEEDTLMIAMRPEDLVNSNKSDQYKITYTHCEIHPSMILGVVASVIPFSNHNQCPRNTFQAAMGKQAIGIYATNFNQRMDTLGHILYYPQKPLVTTKTVKYVKFGDLPAGQNVVAAIACYSGYNQEDSVILNQSSIDRGLFRSLFFRTYSDQQKEGELFERPNKDNTAGMKRVDYNRLDDDGFLNAGDSVAGGDIIIGKTVELKESQKTDYTAGFTRVDASTSLRASEAGIIDKIMVTNNETTGYKLVKVRIRSIRIPQVGDKFSSRHGQKGTCGITFRQEDLPFTRDGIVPDLIMNPHAIPSRMTVGHLIECLMGKVTAIQGEEGDATPFVDDITVHDIASKLHSHGYQMYGNEVVFNGHTGRKMEAQIFLGPMYYQRLKHLVDDKMYSRSRGKVNMLTRQPVEGRSRGGGLRFGEMERDVMIAHGSSRFLKERLLTLSDEYKTYICELCGFIAEVNHIDKTYTCKSCRNNVKIAQVTIPYAVKLLFQELMSMNIAPRMFTNVPKNDKDGVIERG